MATPVDKEALDALAAFKEAAAGPLTVLDLIGTFVFAISGGIAAVRVRLDIFGVLVLAFAASVSGGIIRDVLIGAVPPAAITDWRYLSVALVAGLFVFFWYPHSKYLYQRRNILLIFDAAGLAVFAVAGTLKALALGLNPVMAALLGMLTGIGGGIVRDLLINQIPTVLRSELYAIAALAGSSVVVAGHFANIPPILSVTAGAVLCFGIRIFAIRRRWNLPVAPLPERRDELIEPVNTADSVTDKEEI